MASLQDHYVKHIYRVECPTRDVPKLRHGKFLAEFPHNEREMWTKFKKVAELVAAGDPEARIERYEGRQCPRCGRWMIGLQAQLARDREDVARMMGEEVAPCSSACSVSR